MPSRSPSRERYRSRDRSLTRSVDSRSPSRSLSRPPTRRRRRYDSLSRSGSPPPRRNGRHENGSRSRSRGRDRSLSPLAGGTKVGCHLKSRLASRKSGQSAWNPMLTILCRLLSNASRKTSTRTICTRSLVNLARSRTWISQSVDNVRTAPNPPVS